MLAQKQTSRKIKRGGNSLKQITGHESESKPLPFYLQTDKLPYKKCMFLTMYSKFSHCSEKTPIYTEIPGTWTFIGRMQKFQYKIPEEENPPICYN